MAWDDLVLVETDDLGALEPETTAPNQPLGDATWTTQMEQAKLDLKIWFQTDFADTEDVEDLVQANDGLERVCAYLSLYHIYNGLQTAAAEPDQWRTKAQYYWDMARNLYAAMKNSGALQIDFDEDGTIDDEEEAVRAPFVFRRG